MEANELIEDMLNKNPMSTFSVYTDIQSRAVRSLAHEILACFESGIVSDDGTGKGTVCGGDVINRGYGQFWLWVLGAYEIVRTMDQAKQCFSPRVAGELNVLKRRLAVIRMPFAKQELPGKSLPVRGEPSIYGIGDSPSDLRFNVEGQVISARDLIGEFLRVMGGITRADILADHRTSYSCDTV
ncbi:MAG: hypothetical protein ACJ8C4_13030 [Gemmataceae bacterium]